MTQLRPLVPFALLVALIDPTRGDDRVATPPDAPVSFHRQVLPILQRKCQGCHQPAKANGKLNLTTFEIQPGPISAIAFAPYGATLAVGGSGGGARVYRVADGARVATLPGHKGGIYALAYAPDGPKIATGGFDGTVRVFAVGDGKLLASFIPVPIATPLAAH